MTKGEAVNWLINITADIGKAEHRDLWHYEQALSEIREMLEELPIIEERKTGKWTKGSDMSPMKHRNGKPKKFWPSFRYCSACGHEAYDDSDWGEQLFDWCPYCGADMRGETE